jgi:2-polyprenyl-6-methoxyphenol hydroxylase-like FAD-dependent oxidoreductase
MTYDVVISGAGPIGLFLACELRAHGMRTVLLERRTEIDPTLKAGGVNGRGADILTRRGLVELLGPLPSMADLMGGMKPGGDSPQARPARGAMPKGHFAGLKILRGGSSPSSPPILAPQQRIEEALEKRAVELGAEVRRGHSVVGLDQNDDGVTIAVEGPAGPYDLHAGWLVGCDGGRSTVRKLAGFAFPGLDGIITGYQAIADFDDPDFFPLGWHRTEHGLMVRGPIPKRVFTAQFDGPPADRDAPITREELQAAVRRVSGTSVTVTAVHSVTRFTDNTRQATTYRLGRVLLAGDAAHIHPPFGGQGLHLGLADAVNLAWKLAASVHGWAPEGLLDTYTAERHPVAERALHNAQAQMALLFPGPHVSALRDIFTALAETPEANRLLSDLMGELDVRYEATGDHPLAGLYCPDLTLKTALGETRVAELSRGGRGLLLDLADREDVRDTVRPWARRIEAVTGAAETMADAADAVLIRPDGHVAWAGEDVGGLREAVRRWFGESPAA